MKRVLAFFTTLALSTTLLAQEEVARDTSTFATWSSESKTYWLISIAALSLFLVARTFRNKPDA